MRKQYSGPFQAKLTWMTPALQLKLLEHLMSTLKIARLWNMLSTPSLSSLNHNVPSAPPCQQAGQAATCTSLLHFFSSFPFSLLFPVQCSFIPHRKTSRLKKKLPNLNYITTGTSREHFFLCESITNYNLKCSCLERGTNAAWRTPCLAPESNFSLVSYLFASTDELCKK